ncbi:MAG: PEGA domain-containing protein [Polyangiaceae bacterium]
MRRHLKRLLTLLTMLSVAFCFTLSPATASAMPTWKKRREANKLLQQAKVDERKGDASEAARKLKKADTLLPKPSTKKRIAEQLIKMGDLVQAMDVLREAMNSKPRSWVEKKAVKKSIELLSATEDRVPTIEVNAFKPDANAMTITIDGEDYEGTDGPVARNPGTYNIKATAEGYKDWTQTVTVAERARSSIDVTMVASDGGDSASGGDFSWGRKPAYIAWGVGGLGLAVGIGFGVAAISTTNAVLREWDCKDSVCPAEAEADLIAAKTNGNLSTTGFVVGGAGIVAGTVLFLLADGDDAKESEDGEADEASGRRLNITAKPIVGPAYVGLQGTF